VITAELAPARWASAVEKTPCWRAAIVASRMSMSLTIHRYLQDGESFD
jgi:hypothetical protein